MDVMSCQVSRSVKYQPEPDYEQEIFPDRDFMCDWALDWLHISRTGNTCVAHFQISGLIQRHTQSRGVADMTRNTQTEAFQVRVAVSGEYLKHQPNV